MTLMVIAARGALVAALLGGMSSWRAEVQARKNCDKTESPRFEYAAKASDPHGDVARNLAATVILAHEHHFLNSPPTLGQRTRVAGTACERQQCEWTATSWKDEPSFAICSGVLVEKDVVVTPMHCLCYLNDIFSIRVHPADWTSRASNDANWRVVEAVLLPRLEGEEGRPSGAACQGDFVFLKLSGEIAEPVRPRKASSRSKAEERAYMIASPLGIPGTLTRGRVGIEPVDSQGCSSHDMYAVMNSSGGAIYGDNGDFLGLHVQPLDSKCGCPKVRLPNDLLFPVPKAGRYLPLSHEIIRRHLDSAAWIPAEDWNKQPRNGCNGKISKMRADEFDWNC